MDLSKQLKTWGEIMPQPNAWIAEKNEECKNPLQKEYGESFALRDARRKDTWISPTKSWWTLEEWN